MDRTTSLGEKFCRQRTRSTRAPHGRPRAGQMQPRLAAALALATCAAGQHGTSPCFEGDLCDRDAASVAESEEQCTAAGVECSWDGRRGRCSGTRQCPELLAVCVANPTCLAAAQVSEDDPSTPRNERAAAWAGSAEFSSYLVRADLCRRWCKRLAQAGSTVARVPRYPALRQCGRLCARVLLHRAVSADARTLRAATRWRSCTATRRRSQP